MASRGRSSRAERRELVERLLREHHDRSDRSIARLAGASHTLVAVIRRELVAAGAIAARSHRPEVATQAGHGNLVRQPAGEPGPALRHGGYSELRRAPLEDEHRARLAAEFPHALAMPGGNDLLNAAARRLAIADLIMAWVQEAGPIFARGGAAEVSAPTRELRSLLDAHERSVLALAELEAKAIGENGGSGLARLRQRGAEIINMREASDGE
jgi:hypothetical protein